MPNAVVRHHGKSRPSRRGVTLVEVLFSALVIGFLTAGVATLSSIGEAQSQAARTYSYAQSDIRTALRTITRTLRHGYTVRATGTLGSLAGIQSNASQVVCVIPQLPNSANIEIEFYVSGGVLYYQRSTDASPGTALLTGANSLSIVYYTTSSGVTAETVSPSLATEMQITVSATRGSVTTEAQAYVWLRN